MEGLSIVVPIYNEKDSITSTVDELSTAVMALGEPSELILVNDGSRDGSGEILEHLSTERTGLPVRVQVVHHPQNRGYGASLKTGISNASYETIAITDADSTYPNEQLPELLKIYRRGYRMVVGARSFRKLPLATRPAKWFLNQLANFLVGRRIPDINSGLRIFDRETARRFFPMISDGFSFTTTITLAMLSSSQPVHYEPIEYKHRKGSSKIRPIRDTLRFIQLIIRTVMYFDPLKVFLPTSLFVGLAAIVLYVLGRLGLLFSEPPADIAMVLGIGALQILATGMLADLIVKRRAL